MATGQLQGLRHQIRDIVGDGATYNGLAGKAGLSFAQQRAEFESIAPRVGEKVISLRAKADELETKQSQVEKIVAQALAVIADREADPNFEASNQVDEDPDFEDEDDDEDFDDEDFEEFEDPDDEDEPSLTEKVKNKLHI